MTSVPAAARSDPAPESPGVVIGNHTPKYTAKNPAIRWLTRRWLDRITATLDDVARDTTVSSPLEVGAGEGVVSAALHGRFGRAVAVDLPDAGLRAEWRDRPGPAYLHADALRLPFANDAFDLVVCVEVLEHLSDPVQGLRELTRVGTRDLVISVPREPIFRMCNLVAGRYVRDLGNTPGHLNHWSTRSFRRFVGSVGDLRALSQPFPWTIAWVRLR